MKPSTFQGGITGVKMSDLDEFHPIKHHLLTRLGFSDYMGCFEPQSYLFQHSGKLETISGKLSMEIPEFVDVFNIGKEDFHCYC